jgi:hypothetical protein
VWDRLDLCPPLAGLASQPARIATAPTHTCGTTVFLGLCEWLAPCTQSIITDEIPFVKALFSEFEEVRAGWVGLTNSWARAKRVTSQYESVLWNQEVKHSAAPVMAFWLVPFVGLHDPPLMK